MIDADYLILDGYNVINSWPELIALQEQNLEHARKQLEEYATNYAAFKGVRSIVVYDGQDMGVSGVPREEVRNKQLSVVFTNTDMTADSYIERRVYEILRRKKVVFVVTGDYSEQLAVLGTGAYRLSVRELRADYKRAQQEMQKKGMRTQQISRNEIGSRLKPDVLDKLEQLRRNNDRS